jgi:hypothetical protein
VGLDHLRESFMSARSRVVALTIALAGTALTGVLIWTQIDASPEPANAAPSAAGGPSVTPERALDEVRAHFRLAPDRRFQLAIADIYRIATGKPSEPVTAVWSGDRWLRIPRPTPLHPLRDLLFARPQRSRHSPSSTSAGATAPGIPAPPPGPLRC